MVQVKDQKQDENHDIEKLAPETPVELEALHRLLSWIVPFHALFFQPAAEKGKQYTNVTSDLSLQE